MKKLVVGLVLLVASPAWAAFHLMQITEVFPGTNAQPNAQYIELQMWSAGQNLVSTHSVTVYDATGGLVGTYTFAANVPNGGNQATILIATTQAATLFGVTPDLVMTPTIALAGGAVCFETIDCVAWGTFTGASPPSPVGTPAYQAKGLIVGRALARKLGANTMLDPSDDTNKSADDFVWSTPSPKTNPGVTGTNPTSTCGNNAIEGLESCDDNNTASNDGCSSTCVTESCGDGIVQSSEQCDDTNTNMGDTCSNSCMTQMAVDTPPDSGVAPPDGDNINPTKDSGGCCQTGGPGAAPALGLFVLGLLLRRRRVS